MANAISHGLCDTPNQLKIAFKMPPKPQSPILAQAEALIDSIAQVKEAYEADNNDVPNRCRTHCWTPIAMTQNCILTRSRSTCESFPPHTLGPRYLQKLDWKQWLTLTASVGERWVLTIITTTPPVISNKMYSNSNFDMWFDFRNHWWYIREKPRKILRESWRRKYRWCIRSVVHFYIWQKWWREWSGWDIDSYTLFHGLTWICPETPRSFF